MQNYSAKAWDAVWASVSNPITNDDDDKTWFKVIHRALNVHNRNPRCSSECRMPGCAAEESIMHLVSCPKYKVVWKKAIDFLVAAGEARPQHQPSAIVLGLCRQNWVG